MLLYGGFLTAFDMLPFYDIPRKACRFQLFLIWDSSEADPETKI